MNITVIGTGYVGLVTGTCFAETGNHVVCVDIDENKIQKLQQGELPIYEPGLNVLFERNKRQGRLSFTTDLKEGIQDAQIIFLALPTPQGEDGSADLSYVLQVAEDISGLLDHYAVVVDKSTVPVGTAERVADILGKKLSEDMFDVVSNPEFLREGVAVDDFLKPDRVVIGTSSKRAEKVMLELYKPFVRQGNPIITMDIRSAELTKYAANSYLATRISFMNEVANLCEKLGADVDMVRKGMGSDSRIGKRFLFPGVGYGGSCFPKDVKALQKSSTESGYEFNIINSVIQVNERQRLRIFDKMFDYFEGDLRDKKIGIWGLAFKPETDDIREAPAVYTIEKLLEHQADVHVYDPEAMDNIKKVFGSKLSYGSNQYEILHGAEALAIMTEWSVFRTPDFNRIKDIMKSPIIFDGRNLFDSAEIYHKGIVYQSIGR